ncbi:WPP domain-interacting tail-anchored protein 1-like isoform X2 [Tasmannia lanceolata]|uniref:WPP domain-interacting tail-anchored protein 1-like isoform X2 n=1 Tax=Tasmannia lanceolata TaxID=3420 RepID=UPI0040637E4E
MSIDGNPGDNPNAEKMSELENPGEVLTRIDLDLTCSSEKLLNLDILLMHVAARASDYEVLTTENEDISADFVEKALEFDLLSGILDSEVKELDDFMISLKGAIVDAQEKISSHEHLNESFLELEKKLRDSEKSLKKSQDQVSEMRMQSAKFQSTISLAFGGQQSWNSGVADFSENQFTSMNAEVKMQTVEQQRHILRMLEKSLARELDLEKKLSESRINEEDLQLKLHYAGQEMFGMEEMTEIVLERLFEAENVAEVLTGVSKELMGKLQVVQFNLNGSIQRESELRSRNLESVTLREKVNSLEEQQNMLYSEINDLENAVEDLRSKLMKAESRAESAEGKCKLLAETNLEINEELGFFKSNTVEKLNFLEKELRQSDTKLQHAKASMEASKEQQSMLYSAISDMENLIEDLKANVLKAESRAESVEAKCVLLTETNLELNEELGFLRGRIECLETSLHQADDAKKATAKDIGIRTKIITDLVMQLAMERERLQIKISLLEKDNNILLKKYWKTKSTTPVLSHNGDERGNQDVFLNNGSVSAQGSKSFEESLGESSATSFRVDKFVKDEVAGENEVESTVLAEDSTGMASKLETVRTIDAGQLNSKSDSYRRD